MTLDTYGHVFDELEDVEPVTSEEPIRAARATNEARVSRCDPAAGASAKRQTKTPLSGASREPTRGPSSPCRQAKLADSEGQRGAHGYLIVFGWCSDPRRAGRSQTRSRVVTA